MDGKHHVYLLTGLSRELSRDLKMNREVELDSQDSSAEIKSREVELDSQESSAEIKSREVELTLRRLDNPLFQLFLDSCIL